ncbi:MAG: bis(5'-nucleosyl)-tetraphosphatase (symmetrical) YqeK [Ruminococcus sp.]|nr:bis(5'-nucleosyl)-tetraphosphatase (symmetrical) YqeK [Ruminococcus sp.]
MTEWETYDIYLKEHLSQKRYVHSRNVAEASERLAKRYGGVSVEKAFFAGLVHDISKEDPKETQYELVCRSKMQVCEEERQAFKVWHGIAGAVRLEEQFGVTDLDILRAVRFHTVGRAGMSQLEKIVYLADMISKERSYSDVDVMRRKAMESLNVGMLYALEYSLKKLLRKEVRIPHYTVEAYNEMLTALQQEG